ncbi:MAG: PstS family phosphate ABC transporter substrate-binding protein [Dehalococcoidia bacterium]
MPAAAILLFLVVALATVACDDATEEAIAPMTEPPPNAADLGQLSGEIVIDGSSTVYPITQAAAEEFLRYGRRVRISVGIAGTGGGFKKFCAGDVDITNASRPISPSEREICDARGIDFIEVPVAYDGIAVVVHPDNTWVDCLSVDELRRIWEPAAQGAVSNWNQVRDTFPDRPLTLFGPATDSGTFDYFTEAVVGIEKSSRGDYQASEDDNVLVTGVGGDPGALGYFGFAYVVENPGKVKAVPIDGTGSGGCVAPSAQSIKEGAYQPLSRLLFLYVRATSAARPAVDAFVRFYLSNSFTPLIETPEVGYVALPDAAYKALIQRFSAGTTGTLFPNGIEVGTVLDRYLR